MRMYLIKLYCFLVVPLMLIMFVGDVVAEEYQRSENPVIKVVLVGASIGNQWDIEGLPKRIGLDEKEFELGFIPVFDDFDKLPAIREAVEGGGAPDILVIKECSVYFPGPLDEYKLMISSWAKYLEENNIRLVLATTVPIARNSGLVFEAKSLLKRVMGKPNKIDEISKYNDWIRDFSQKKGYQVLDLEMALRVSAAERYMNPKYDIGDRVHLNSLAYGELDQVMKEFLSSLK